MKAQPEKGITITDMVSQNMFSLATYAGSSLADAADIISRIKPEYLPAPSIVGRASKNVPPSPTALFFMAHFVEVEVDTDTGDVKILRYVAVHDSGRIVNPEVAENQVAGGIRVGCGLGLSETLIFDEETGKVLNPNWLDYKVLTALDMPDPEIAFVEVIDPVGPFGAKGLGEGPAIPSAPALAQAIHNAVGVRINPPITADKIIRALKSKTTNGKGGDYDIT